LTPCPPDFFKKPCSIDELISLLFLVIFLLLIVFLVFLVTLPPLTRLTLKGYLVLRLAKEDDAIIGDVRWKAVVSGDRAIILQSTLLTDLVFIAPLLGITPGNLGHAHRNNYPLRMKAITFQCEQKRLTVKDLVRALVDTNHYRMAYRLTTWFSASRCHLGDDYDLLPQEPC